ncbi:MAG: hypothetical protein LBF87_00395 [Treponema sp.]|nr:hypothetical protein [Treponema sp.]
MKNFSKRALLTLTRVVIFAAVSLVFGVAVELVITADLWPDFNQLLTGGRIICIGAYPFQRCWLRLCG